MFNTLKEFIDKNLFSNDDPARESVATSLELAAAILMLEISLADAHLHDEERRVIEMAMQDIFHLSRDDTETLINLAENEVDHAVSLHDFTRLLNQQMSNEEKIKIIELLWQVAYADAILDKYEEYYIRKIADLLYISHKDYIKTKHKAIAPRN